MDPAHVGRPVQAVVVMDCYSPTCILRDPEVATWPEIRECCRATGQGCSGLVVAVPSIQHFQELIDRLARYGRPSGSMVFADMLPWGPVTPAETS